MKTTTLKAAAAFGLSALLAGSVAAQDSVSKPVGYETITVPNGFSYAGLRLHEAPVASGLVGTASGTVVPVPDVVTDALTAGVTYIFEVTGGDAAGATVLVESFDAAANTVTLSDDLSANLEPESPFTIRPAATLASVFGAANSAGLDEGSGGPNNADVVYVVNASGGFDRYYYDSFNAETFEATWSDAGNNAAVNAADIPIVYTDGILILGSGVNNNTFVVSGSVKLTNSTSMLFNGFNYVGTVYPVGSTLASAFGASNSAGFRTGSGGPNNADVIYVPSATGFDRYYYDTFNPNTFEETWSNAADNSAVDSTTVSFDNASSIIIFHPGTDPDGTPLVTLAPAIYSSL